MAHQTRADGWCIQFPQLQMDVFTKPSFNLILFEAEKKKKKAGRPKNKKRLMF